MRLPECDCEECLEKDEPCNCDCDIGETECYGCQMARLEQEDTVAEIDFAQGRY